MFRLFSFFGRSRTTVAMWPVTLPAMLDASFDSEEEGEGDPATGAEESERADM
jgi:hypothetical protein